MSMVDVDSVGAGGGSIAWVDSVGALRVGPSSAGAVPGPACYGGGGERATVTDALLLLGYLDPDRFLGGRASLDVGAAEQACARLGGELGLSVEETAWGIREVSLATMSRAVRARVASRGLSGADHALAGYGGCGPLFAAELGDVLKARLVAVPALASVLSAYGTASAALRRERAHSVLVRLPAPPDDLQAVIATLRAAAAEDLEHDGVAADRRAVHVELDLRFERQSWELSVPARFDAAGELDLAATADEFRAEYARRFGEGALATGVATEVVTVRAVGTEARVAAERQPEAPGAAERPRPSGQRSLKLGRDHAPEAVPAYEREQLAPGDALGGPALVDASDHTTWIPPGHGAVVDGWGTLIITRGRP
jgi:N-methylhydantoinase A